MKKLNKDNKGFSLVELLVVIAIMVVLVGVLAPTLLGNIEKSRVSSDIQVLDSIAGAIQSAIGSDEKAYTEAMEMAGTTQYKVMDLYSTAGLSYTPAGGTAKNATSIRDLMGEYLASSKIDFKGTEARKKFVKGTSTDKLVFTIDANGTITVMLLDDTAALQTKNVTYSVTR
jgi:prepilin-type N-terminal cleavage/methylation domain-containing protein